MYSTFYYMCVNAPILAAIFWIIFIIRSPYPEDKTRRKVLLLYMVNSGILMFASGNYFYPTSELYNISKVFQIFSITSTFPLYFMYIRLIASDVKFNPKLLLILLPGLILGLSTAILLYFTPDRAASQLHNTFMHGYNFARDTDWQVKVLFAIDVSATVIIIASTAILLVSINRSINEFKATVSQYYANAAHRVKGLKFAISVGGVYSVVVVFGSLYGGSEVYQYNLLSLFIAAIAAIFPVFVLGNLSQFQRFDVTEFVKEMHPEVASVIIEDKPSIKEVEKPQPTTVTEIIKEETEALNFNDINLNYLSERIVEVVENRQLYLNADLRITDISQLLSTNRTYISQAINLKLGGNFSDFINNYRIEYTKKLLSDPDRQNFTIEAVAEESGYATVASLNRLFKIKTGMTPNQYRHAHLLSRIGKSNKD